MQQTLLPEPSPVAAGQSRPLVWWRGVAWALLACWVLLLAAVVFAGAREATYADLRADIAAGEVTEVRVERGVSLARGPVEIHWRTSPVTAYTAQVDVDRVRSRYPELHVVRWDRGDAHAELLGREVRGQPWFVLAYFVLHLATIVLLALAPVWWRATAWAWFWVLWLLPPLGAIAYLVLGGPTGIVGPPRNPSPRLRGGCAFVLTAVLAGVMTG